MKTRDLYAYIVDCMEGCSALMALLDSADGIRRVDRPKQLNFSSCLCYGGAQGAPIPEFEAEAVQDANVVFRPYVRIDAETTSGDLVVGDIIYWLKRIFGCAKCPMTCCGTPAQLIVMNVRYLGELDDCRVYEPLQAWTQTVEFRFRVVYQCCRPGQELYIT